MDFKKQEVANWNYGQVWDKFPVPARPSKEELKFLEKELRRIKPKNVLILGSTIEYRRLCKKLRTIPFVADFSKSNYEMLTKYSKEKFLKEHFLEIDWLQIKDKNKYDVILGHRAFNVIGKSMTNKFFSVMFEALKPEGIFYCKGNLQFNNEDNLLQLIRKYAYRKRRKYNLFSYIEVQLYFHCSDKNGYVDYPKARKLMEKLYEKGNISNEDYDLIKILISMSSQARFRGKIPIKEIKSAIKSAGFKDDWIFMDKEICSNMPIIKLAKQPDIR
ncbi:MAG TPA: hypothetical protein VJJ52_03995 [Candidatus Nanoarchaeia archaeon]|nr:hypothetical protein [Candidatus Nanoarchaeia archaeon]